MRANCQRAGPGGIGKDGRSRMWRSAMPFRASFPRCRTRHSGSLGPQSITAICPRPLFLCVQDCGLTGLWLMALASISFQPLQACHSLRQTILSRPSRSTIQPACFSLIFFPYPRAPLPLITAAAAAHSLKSCASCSSTHHSAPASSLFFLPSLTRCQPSPTINKFNSPPLLTLHTPSAEARVYPCCVVLAAATAAPAFLV